MLGRKPKREMAKITVQNTQITVLSHDDKDYISLTDMANGKQSDSRAADIIKNWIRTRYTIEFLGTWEMIHNPNFKVVEFDHFKMQAGLPNFTQHQCCAHQTTVCHKVNALSNSIRLPFSKCRYLRETAEGIC